MAHLTGGNAPIDSFIESARHFVEGFRRLRKLDAEHVGNLVALIESLDEDDLDEDDFEACYETVARSLFPESWLEPADLSVPDADSAVLDELRDEEDHFASRVRHLMSERGLSQTTLARLIGVGQPAVSLMLSRRMRPQLRTVKRIAEALGVAPCSLWPSASATEESAESLIEAKAGPEPLLQSDCDPFEAELSKHGAERLAA